MKRFFKRIEREHLRRLSLRTFEQGAWSLSSFLGSAVGASVLPMRDFGALALASACVGLCQAFGRAIFSEPLAVFAALEPGGLRAAHSSAVRQLLLVGPLLFAVGALVSFVIVPRDYVLLALAACVTAATALMADLNRAYRLIKHQEALSGKSLAWGLLAQAVTTVSLFLALGGDSSAFLFGWAAALAVVGFVALDLLPREGKSPEWVRRQRESAKFFLPEAVLTAGATQLGVMLIALSAGLVGAAASRGAFLLLFPVNMYIQSVSQVVVPRTAVKVSTRGGVGSLAVLAVGSALAVTLYGGAISAAAPAVQLLLGETADAALEVFVGPTLCLAATVFFLYPWGGARAAGLLHLGLIARAIVAPLTAFAPAVFVVALGWSRGIAFGYALVGVGISVAGSIILWRLHRRAGATGAPLSREEGSLASEMH